MHALLGELSINSLNDNRPVRSGSETYLAEDSIPWPVSNSVPKPMTKPSIANRPFQVSAKLLKPNRG